MKVKSESEVAQSCLTLGDPMDCSPPGSSFHGIFQARVLEWGAIAFSDIVLYFTVMGLLWWLRGKESACNAGDAGSIPGLGRSPGEGNGTLLQGIFLTQKLNPGFLHCRQILCHLSRQGSLPTVVIILQYMQIKPLSIIP